MLANPQFARPRPALLDSRQFHLCRLAPAGSCSPHKRDHRLNRLRWAFAGPFQREVGYFRLWPGTVSGGGPDFHFAVNADSSPSISSGLKGLASARRAQHSDPNQPEDQANSPLQPGHLNVMGPRGLLAHNQCTEIANVPGARPQIGE